MRLKILQSGEEEEFEAMCNEFYEKHNVVSAQYRTELGAGYKYGVIFIAFLSYKD